MKKPLFFLLICIVLCGCNKKIKLEINECIGGIYSKESSGGPNNHENIYDILGDSGCYLFKEYNDFNGFLNEHDLLLNKKNMSKYSQEFFFDKALIIYFRLDSSSGYKYIFNLHSEKKILRMEIKIFRDKNKDYMDEEICRIFFIDISKEEIVNTNEFVVSTSFSK